MAGDVPRPRPAADASARCIGGRHRQHRRDLLPDRAVAEGAVPRGQAAGRLRRGAAPRSAGGRWRTRRSSPRTTSRRRRSTSTASCPSTRASSATSSAPAASSPAGSRERYADALEEPLPDDAARAAGAARRWRRRCAASTSRAEDDDLERARRAQQSRAHRRLAFDELFFLQLGHGAAAAGREGASRASPSTSRDERLARREGAAAVPAHRRAGARGRARWRATWRRPEPMNRLLQGDVGSRQDGGGAGRRRRWRCRTATRWR